MPVPAQLADLSTTAGSNSPTGSESPTLADDYLRQHAAFIAMLRDGAGNPTGTLLPYAGATAPTGYLLCNGAAVSRITYAVLYAVIGTTYGVGDGATTFNVPNSVDRMLLGAGNLYANGATGGSKDAVAIAHTHTVSASGTSGTESNTHSHNVGDPGHAHGLDGQTIQGGVPTSPSALTDGSARGLGTSTAVATTGITLSTQTTNHTHAVTVTGTAASSGATGTDLNLPPYLGVRFIIKT